MFLGVSMPLPGADLQVRDYGAKGDGTTKDTAAIQSAIDAAAANGGARVVLADGTFLSGAIQLRTGVDLHIDRTAKLLASPDIADFPDWPDAKHVVKDCLPRRRSAAFIFADEAERIAITGDGTIDCNGTYHTREKSNPNWTGWKYERVHDTTNSLPRVVFLAGCRDIVLKDVTMVGQPSGWSYWIHDCDRVQVSGLKILADVRYPNNDGIHVNCSRDVTVSDCMIETGDDSIVVRANSRSLRENRPCERVVVSNCTLRSWANGIRIGWTNDGAMRDCRFSNIVMHDTSVGIAFVLPRKSGTDYGREATLVENLSFSNISMRGIYGRPILAEIAPAERGVLAKAMRNIRFENVKATGLELPLMSGRPGCPLQDWTFSNCSFRKVAEKALPGLKRYHSFVRPYKKEDKVEHVEGLIYDNVRFDAS